ncbi:MAG: ATP-binding cassette domain-containing protein [Chloroflexi bacterium]|nr:ATP-binding cassette domain-containing protein [Chloroflexota bacterium]
MLEVFRIGQQGHTEDLMADLLRFGRFRYDDLNKAVGRLSTGQQRKLELARLIARRPHALLLDEPTNHLSLDVRGGLEAALSDFPGP